MGGNRGFGAAINRTAHEAEGDVLVVINDDFTPSRGFLTALVEPIAKGAVMAAGVLLQKDRLQLIESAGIEVDATLGAHDYLRDEPVEVLDQSLPPPLGPCGGAAAYRVDAFRSIGGFDEGFFAYFEDLDLALQLRAEGASCALAGRARGVHAGSATLGCGSVEKATLVGFSRGYLLRKYGVLNALVPGALAVAQEGVASLVLAQRHRSLAPARARLYGWRACRVRAPRPSGDAFTVGVGDSLRRRHSRASRARR
jgi:N-acetylglucosaminyl-diphospho-decaprenol L-rhamnosyltransferase